jgi:acyl-CoA reductase-like NAD-dependent aldehyde dehydrogenase
MSTETRDAAELRLPPLDLFIGGEWREASSGARFACVNPADASRLGEVAEATVEDAAAAVEAARAAMNDKWSRLPASERGKLLWRLGDAILANADELAALESADTGKPIAEAKMIRCCCRRASSPWRFARATPSSTSPRARPRCRHCGWPNSRTRSASRPERGT